MLAALTQLLLFQIMGEIVAHTLALPVPGPVIGMLLLFGSLVLRQGPGRDLQHTSQTLLQHLSLLFVPAGTGIMLHLHRLLDILPVMNDGDSLYRTAISDRISLRRLIQQNAYLSDSNHGRQITGDFCARFQVPNGGRVRNFIHTSGNSSTENGYAVGALNLGLNPEASRAPGNKRRRNPRPLGRGGCQHL